jgi:tetraacyldisaccharide 4'-kinase
MKLLRYLAFPFVPIYYLVTWFRNLLYDYNIKSSKSYDLPIICVGNLSTGGTGKTPMVEYLIRLLKEDYELATLSRGYGRKTKGFQLGNEYASAEVLGDEPFQFYNKFKKSISVAVDGDRQNGISNLLNLKPTPEVIVLDDAFQHRKVKAGFNILLTTYSNLYFKDWVLPSGNLREPRQGAKRAQLIVITKCPDTITEAEKKTIRKRITKENQQVFFSTIAYSNTVVSNSESRVLNTLPKFTLVTGIANASTLTTFLKSEQLEFNHLEYKDHYHFSDSDVEIIASNDLIITTEKDYVRLKDYKQLEGKLFYLPIEVQIENAIAITTAITAYVEKGVK